MNNEPRHRQWDLPASECIAGYPDRLPENGVIGLWEIVVDGRRWFRLEGAELTNYVRRSVQGLLDNGAKPVKEIGDAEYVWVLQPQYGVENAQIVDAVIAEWLASGSDPNPTDVWFALPQICETRERRDGLDRMLEFLHFLREKNIHFTIEQQRSDAVMVTFTLVGVRVEIEFFVDHFEFSFFKGDEGVESDERLLYDLIKENWD